MGKQRLGLDLRRDRAFYAANTWKQPIPPSCMPDVNRRSKSTCSYFHSICDIQEKFRSAIYEYPKVLDSLQDPMISFSLIKSISTQNIDGTEDARGKYVLFQTTQLLPWTMFPHFMI